MKWIIGIICFIIVILLYIAYVYLRAKLEVKAAPREDMFMCDKHGAFRKRHLIKFLDMEYCPLCFDEKMQQPLDSTIDIGMWKPR